VRERSRFGLIRVHIGGGPGRWRVLVVVVFGCLGVV